MLPCLDTLALVWRHVATLPDAAKKRVELFLPRFVGVILFRSFDVVKNDVYDVIQPRRERKREATMEECERRRNEGGRNGVSNLDGKPNEERNESSLSLPGK